MPPCSCCRCCAGAGNGTCCGSTGGPSPSSASLNSALPFLCFSYAALSITAGLASIFNAAAPLFGATIAWLWLKDRLSAPRIVGLGLGFAGVLWLAWDKASLQARRRRAGRSLACLVATLFYGIAANFTKRHLAGVAPLAVAAGSQLGRRAGAGAAG